ncbi:MAG: DJ-1/PfpI/YhbO family deglycase/protease [Alphaproteobacteria bacterium]|nr:DJ-1/PfpI/YhbO family deglycase/protease [Alphaproteobacteria bacterium]
MKDVSKGKIAILATDGFGQSELILPLELLRSAGADVEVVSLKPGKIRGWNKDHWDKEIEVDKTLDEAAADDYGLLVLPGGQINPGRLRIEARAVDFVKAFASLDKPIAAICHGPWLLIEAGAVKGRKLTSYRSIRMDITNAGGKWVDEEVVVDGNLITSRKPEDIPAFIERVCEAAGVSSCG